jgi:hypothetical protein
MSSTRSITAYESLKKKRLIPSGPAKPTAHGEVEQLVDSADSLGPARVELARRLRSREAELQEAIFAHMRSVVPDVIADEDEQLGRGLREMIAACMDCGLSSIERGAPWSGSMPPAVAVHVSRAASGGVSLTTALGRCVAGHTLGWSLVLNEVACNDLPDEQRFALLLQVSAALGSLLARVQAEVASAHSLEIKRRARSHEQCRAEIVHRLLAGESPDDSERAELGYELDAWHLAVIVTGADAESTVRSLAAALGRQLLIIRHNAETVRAWLGGERKLMITDIEQVLSAQAEADVFVAASETARGLDGWRVTNREAEAAQLVARCSGQAGLTRYLDVAPEANALQDQALQDSLIGTYLSPLDGMRIGGQAARRTLRALFDAEHNVSSAAHKLNVDRSTVHRQRNEIERRLGCRLPEHQVDIEIALRVEELLERRDSAQSSGASS